MEKTDIVFEAKKYSTSEAAQLQRKRNAQRKHKIALLRTLQEKLDLMTNKDLMLEKNVDDISQVFPFETLINTVYFEEYQKYFEMDPRYLDLVHQLQETQANLEATVAKATALEKNLNFLKEKVTKLRMQSKSASADMFYQDNDDTASIVSGRSAKAALRSMSKANNKHKRPE